MTCQGGTGPPRWTLGRLNGPRRFSFWRRKNRCTARACAYHAGVMEMLRETRTNRPLTTPQLLLLRALVRRPRQITPKESRTLAVLLDQGLVKDDGRVFRATVAGIRRAAPGADAHSLLVTAAYDERAIDAIDFEFLMTNPDRAHEVTEYITWLAA